MEEEVLEQEIQVQEENYIVQADLSDYYTKEETNDLLGGKQNTLIFDETPTLDSSNPVTSDGIAQALSSAGGGSKTLYFSNSLTYSQKKALMQEWYDEYIAGKNPYIYMTELADGDVSALGFLQYADLESNEKYIYITAFTNTYGSTKPGTITGTSYLFLNMYQIYTIVDGNTVSDVQFTENTIGYIPTTYDFANKSYVDGLVGNINTVLATLTTPSNNGGGA